MSKKNFLIDTILNITATAIPILILQLITLPLVGKKLGGEEYGLVVTLVSLFTVLSFPFGNVLNNIRLLYNQNYEQENLLGDFNILLVRNIIISCIMVILGTIYFEGTFNFLSIGLMILISGINLLREYLIVSFRLILNYKGILINNLLLGWGYILGTFIFYYTSNWQIIYVAAYGTSLIYIIKNTSLIKEPFIKTKLYKKTMSSSWILLLSSFLKNLLIYADKLILFPLLGPKAVSIYYTATIIGKVISMVISPINSVILSYITRMDKFGLKKFFQLLFSLCIIGIFGYVLSILVGPSILRNLYPNWAEESIVLLYITSATAVVGLISTIIHPFILRFTEIKFQLIINGTYIVTYAICALIFFNLFGLLGFSIGIFIASVINLLIMILVFISQSRKQGKI